MEKYHKIKTVHLRDEVTHKLTNKFREETVEYLQNNEWIFTEKIDGTNIRILWNGHTFEFKGRTDNAQIPKQLNTRLTEIFMNDEMEQIFEQKFNDTEVLLFGEGYGAKIQNGGNYSPTQEFILFDVMIKGMYLTKDAMIDIANFINIKHVPFINELSTINQAVEYVKSNPLSKLGNKQMEGVVGTPNVRLLDAQGNRIIVKIKCKDYQRKRNHPQNADIH